MKRLEFLQKLWYNYVNQQGNEVSIVAEKKEKQYVSDNAQLMAEWNWEKNNELGFDPHKLSVGSERKVWWKCSKGHTWEAVCYSRVAGNKCPICSGRKVLSGYNDLSTLHPNIALQWHPTKNGILTTNDVTANSHRKVWWLGSCGHEWEAPVSERTRGRGCPICKSKKVIAGVNDLATTHPNIAKQWHPLLNDKKATQVLPQSNKKAWWICEKGHEYQTSPSHRISRNSDCPICSNKQVLIGYNDLATTHPEIASQWHPEKNDLTPQQVTIGAERKVWWICEKGHEWEALVYSRQDRGCPYCSGNKVWVGFNDLATTHPDIAKEWHPTKNNGLTPFAVTAGSNQKAWWLGNCGHEWEAVIGSRVSGCGCSVCNKERKTSFYENAFYYYIKSVFPDAVQSFKPDWLVHMELDIYIPSIQIAVEYDGQAWHNNTENDIRKGLLCKENGIRLIRIREPKCPSISCESIQLASTNTNDIENAINTLFVDFLNCPQQKDISLDRDRVEIYNLISYHTKSNSFLDCIPDLVAEWHPTLNGNLKPENVSFKSNKKIWWKCAKGHEWTDSCNHRASGRNCPYCSNKRVLAGFNDLATTNPDLAKEWHPTKNEILTPYSVTAGSSKKAWWKCRSCGYEWCAVINSRSRGNGCPQCYKARNKKS